LRCGRRKNRATTDEVEETDDHRARNTMQPDCEFRAVAEEKIEQRQLRLKKQMIIVLVIQCSTTRLWISRCGRRKNRATTAEAEETDDHHAPNTIQHNMTAALWRIKLTRFSLWWLRRRGAVIYGRSLPKFCRSLLPPLHRRRAVTSGTRTEGYSAGCTFNLLLKLRFKWILVSFTFGQFASTVHKTPIVFMSNKCSASSPCSNPLIMKEVDK